MDRTGAYDKLWPWAYKYIVDINNHTASPVLGWDAPISKRHGITPDISAFLMYHFFQEIYFKIADGGTKSPELPGFWLGVNEHVGDLMTFDIYSCKSGKVIQ